MTVKQKLHRLHMGQWAARFKDQASSGLTVKDWCTRNSFTVHSYYYWKRILKEEYIEFIKSIKDESVTGTIAHEAYAMITDILRTDNGYDDLPVRDRQKQRQEHLLPKVDAYFEWVKKKYSQITHNSTIGKASAYSINQEQYLRVFLSDGHIPPDNNPAEQVIRPFTPGRKNFVLIESDNGANASAMLYSLAETAKANGVNTYKYFELLLTELPKHMADSDRSFIDSLLPWSPLIQEKCPSRFKKDQ